MVEITKLSDDELKSHVRKTVTKSHRVTAEMIRALIEVEDRLLYRESGRYTSMFYYCVRELGFSEGEAFLRLAAARLARRFPSVLDAIERGSVHLTNVSLIRKYATAENIEGLLAVAASKSKRELKRQLAELAPRPDVPSTITQARVHAKVDALAPERFKIEFTGDTALVEQIERILALSSHSNPRRDFAMMFRAALALYETRLMKRFGQTDRPRHGATEPTNPRHVPAAIRREVVARDGMRCSFVTDDSKRCTATHHLQFDHINAVALGGTGFRVEDVRILCRAHNLAAAERVFGREKIQQHIRSSRKRGSGGKATEHAATTNSPRRQ